MPGLCVNDSRPKKPEGAGNAGRPLHPQPRVQTWDFSTAPQTYYLNITGNSNNFSGFGVVGSAANITNNAFTFFSYPITLNANLGGATYTNNGTIWVGEGSAQTANITNSANLVIRIMRSGCPCHLLRRKSVPSGYGGDRLAARYDLSDDPCLVLVAPRSPATCTGEHLKPMKRLSDSIIHCVHSKPNGYQNHQTRRSGHHQEGDLGTPLTIKKHLGLFSHHEGKGYWLAGTPLPPTARDLLSGEKSLGDILGEALVEAA